MKILKGLNKNQKEAVVYSEDNSLMVVAGAGAGKTKMLTSKIAYIIKNGSLPSRIFVTTFTKKAADEMCDRLELIIGNKTDRLKLGTSHSLFLRIFKDLREWQNKHEHPKLIMGGGRWMTMVKIINKYSYDNYRNRFATKDIKSILSKISYWKNEGKRVKDLEAHIKEFKIEIYDSDPKTNKDWKFTREGTFIQAYKEYQKELSSQKRIDFDDFLIKTYYELIKTKNVKFLERLKKRIEHIFIDEAQDLNKIQFMLFDLISNGKNMTIVLDDYQCLYGFRGAKISYIQEFQDKYKPTIIKLEQNYRSSPEIVSAGNKLIKHNTTQIWKNLFTDNANGKEPEVIMSMDVEEEARNILDKIECMIVDGYNLNDIAILYRTNAQSRAIVDNFIINHIPHKVYSKEGFYDRKEVKDMLAYLKICYHPNMAEPEDFRRIINRPARFLGGKFIDKIEEIMFDNGYETFWQALQRWPDLNMGATQSSQAKRFVDMITMLSKKIETSEITTKEIFEEIIEETGYLRWLNKELESADEEPDNDTGMNLNSLLFGAERFKNPQDFILFVESMEFEENEDDDAIHCLTIHKSKGMEFPVVFILGCCEKVMPHYKADDFEEERRIAYVAVTRAKEELYISAIYERFNNMKTRPSHYIEEMGVKLPSKFYDYFEEEVKKTKARNKMANNAKKGKFEGVPMITRYDEKGNVISEEEIVTDKPQDNKENFFNQLLESLDEG
jgi:DNA helicase-2/ATP-dependent DNA helicase PcrA